MIEIGLSILITGLVVFLITLAKPIPEGPNEYLLYGGTRGVREITRKKYIWRPVSLCMILVGALLLGISGAT